MALGLDPRSGPRVIVGPQRPVPPSPRELRSRAIHRLQAGVLGLAAMLLIVGLANIIMNRAKLADRQNAPAAAASNSAQAKPADPLADIGVVPAADPSAAAGTGKSP